MSISRAQRQLVRQRAGDCCEYCLLSQTGQLVRFQIDHIIALKHGGTDDDDNLCLACYDCNIFKGSNIATLDPLSGDVTTLYNPRQQHWDDHFEIKSDSTLIGRTPEGRATILVLRLNDEVRIKQRFDEQTVGSYPCKNW